MGSRCQGIGLSAVFSPANGQSSESLALWDNLALLVTGSMNLYYVAARCLAFVRLSCRFRPFVARDV